MHSPPPERPARSLPVSRAGLLGALTCVLLTGCVAPSGSPEPTEAPPPGTATVRQALACSGGGSIDQHAAQCDGAGKLLSWAPPTNPGSSAAYDHVLELNQNYLLAMPDVSGLTNPSVAKPAYYAFSYVCSGTSPGCAPAGAPVGWPHNPAGLYAMLVESGLTYSPYKNDPRLRTTALALLDWHLAHGMTGVGDHWSRVPYASGASGSLTYAGATAGGSVGVGDGVGYLQPEKVGALAWAAVQAFKFNGDTAYRDMAINAANQLTSHLRTPSATVSPWPYRVRASDNAVRTGANIVDNYASNVVEPLKLFQELIRLGQAGTLDGAPGYSATRLSQWQSTQATVLTWLLGPSGPIATQNWTQYFEDVGSDATNNLNQLVPGETAKFLMDNPGLDPNWQAHAQDIIAFIETNFGDALEFGARPIKEQYAFHYKMGSHTARYAAVNARYAELTGDAAAKDKAFRAFNWATYMVRSSGLTIDGPYPNNVWFTDGWGDFIRHFVIGMGAQPDWAPAGQNHLLRTTSVVKSVTYGPGNEVRYTTYDASATEVLRLAFVPSSVTAGGTALSQRADLAADGWTFDPGNNALRIRHSNSGSIVVSGAPPTAPAVAVTAPSSAQNFTAPATLTLGATATPSTGRSIASVTFRAGTTVLCTVSAPVSNPVACTATGSLGNGSHTVSAEAVDSLGESGSASVAITVAGPPTVAIISPASGATLPTGSTTLSTNAIAGAGRTLTRVEFFQGTTSLCFTTTGTACSWNATAGTYSNVFARATDSGSPALVTNSAPIGFTVSASAGGVRLVGVDTVGTQNDYDNGGSVNAFQYTAVATGTLGTLKVFAAPGNANASLSIGVYSDVTGAPGTLLSSCTTAVVDSLPLVTGQWYGCTAAPQVTLTSGTVYWLALLGANGGGVFRYMDQPTGSMRYSPTGLYALPGPTFGGSTVYAGASNASLHGLSTGSTSAPTVSLTSPAANANFTAPANLNLQATATAGPGRTLTKVEFFDHGTTLLCTVNAPGSASVSCGVSSLLDGAHSVTAKATDDLLQTATSAAVALSLSNPPTVSVTSPVANATYTAPASVPLAASATAGHGRSIARVDFYADGATLVCSSTTSPYGCTWSNVAQGSHTVRAVAVDSASPAASTQSSPVSLTVSSAATVPSAPTGLTATAVSSGQIDLTWTDASNNESGFLVERAPDVSGAPGTFAQVGTPAANVTSFSDPGRAASTRYWYRVRATNGAGASAFTAAASATTLAAPTALVGNSTVLTASDFENAGVAAAFSYVASATGTVTRLRLYVDGQSTATTLQLGLYANGSGTPGALLKSCTVATVTANAWNVCDITSQAVTTGTTYWLAVLGPSGGGNVYWRHTSGTGSYKVQPGLTTTLPSTWTGTGGYPGSDMSAYAGN
ncbi:Ig-like domain-containing protein [Corallococcus sp. BB11-1]|uniref:Ig-like domain-containing protein n=1 Tax=Corallococcus sp. BB11-1 TaxID=2996783 RepID=UPI00226EEA88|nr:Ig-like domain-containing protein [Corallococcus sp. BB11-1]MCY1031023.1 Ig-like domain-containing protein [Corallococcus sp. BB11-1]